MRLHLKLKVSFYFYSFFFRFLGYFGSIKFPRSTKVKWLHMLARKQVLFTTFHLLHKILSTDGCRLTSNVAANGDQIFFMQFECLIHVLYFVLLRFVLGE